MCICMYKDTLKIDLHNSICVHIHKVTAYMLSARFPSIATANPVWHAGLPWLR